MARPNPPANRKFVPEERLRHALIALTIALAAGMLTLMRPVDVAAWAFQARLFEHEASGDLVFVRMPPATENTAAVNHDVLRTIEHLRAAGVERIFINIPLQRSDSPQTDARLRALINGNPDSIFLTDSFEQDYTDSDRVPPTSPYFTQNALIFASDYDADFLQFVWGFDKPEDPAKDGTLVPLSFALANKGSARDRVFIDYTIRASSIPTVGSVSLETGLSSLGSMDKTFVLGTDSFGADIRAPSAGTVSPTIIHILAAETLLRGSGHGSPWFAITLGLGIALALGLRFAHTKKRRRAVYFAWCLLLGALFLATAFLGIKAYFAEALLLALIYAIFRVVARYRRRHLAIDPLTRLPNFAALHQDLGSDHEAASDCLVVAKVARLESIFVGLNTAERRQYLREVCNRLALGDRDRTVYYNGSKYLAFVCDGAGIADLEAHLEGLRAIVSQPVRLTGKSLDVAITIGADSSTKDSIDQRLSSAIAAADQAREVYKPVFVVGNDREDWDHSLTSKLTQALADDQIAIKLQPQVDLATHSFIGAEVLARWRDPDGVDVPPSSFILQCERMGRLDNLTRRIFEKSCRAAASIQEQGLLPRISVNVSAVQLVDDRIAQIALETMGAYRTDPALVTIELTETARIEDFSTARRVVDRLKSEGFRLSLDDFGVGSANFEAWFELPFDEIKIDRKFVAGLERLPRANAIVSGIIHSAREAGVAVLAEGIEDRATYDRLATMGCTYGQGYYISRPLWLAEYIAVLKAEREAALPHRDFG
ncbi:GGDEF domain-containing phosphodiesterase [Alteriqipengyuania lutimaris]|uniref:EAL domain-containing protein n=1 Tax=Alteriqipengyuania lutimaris TaxID=1538146 RepID=A0A395LL38_9SPHN|nr:GGDEF domain-containing phosphodiesterase [Alteriqipengyuania lutimaris]MBB3033258.1 EAL domain-containing protein (putative c-di-GMP-specific phosphodiesterase class I)/GGDEF domain-containing protein [Alteriqipengyuania lutimaris]RDS77698.1 EAL domain-containing protein [Alteriqipengyuania lutimaris]